MGIDISKQPESFLSKLPPEERARLGHPLSGPVRAFNTTEGELKRYVAKTERQLQRDVATWLNKRQFYYVSPRIDRKTTLAKGAPDYTVAVDSKFVAIECKCWTTKGKLTPEQEDTMRRVTGGNSRGVYLIIHSIEELEDAFRLFEA